MSDFLSPDLLFVDDDESFAAEFCEYLQAHRFGVKRLSSAENIGAHLGAVQPHLLVLDQFLADIDSLTILQDVRAQFGGGIVMLSGNPDHHDRIVGLELGADDFISKSQSPREILARLRAVARRVGSRAHADRNAPTLNHLGHYENSTPAPSPLLSPPATWTIDTQRRELHTPAGALVRLTAMEFEVLAYLAARVGETVSRDELSTAVLRRVFAPLDRSLDNLVTRIRIALRPFLGARMPIKSVRGVGYVFVGFIDSH